MLPRLLALFALLQVGQIQLPQPTGLVNDFANVLAPESVARMERIAADVRTKSRGEIAIVTLSDLQGRDVADVSLQIGRQWKVGKIGDPTDPTRNAGAVILLVPKETSSDGQGHCRIETGRGTEGFITDATAGEICREATPYFRARDYSRGLELVTYRVAERFAGEFGFTVDTSLAAPEPMPVDRGTRARSGGISPFVLFIIFMVIVMMLGGGRRRSGCGPGCIPIFIPFGGGRGGGFGGGGWGGGGGFGGGGGGGFGGFGGGGGFSGGGGGSNW